MKRVSFVVHAKPLPKGSTKSFRHARTGRIVTTSDTKGLKAYQKLIWLEAKKAWGPKPSELAIKVSVLFQFKKPKKTKNIYPQTDADKLLRGLLDSLTGACYEDDSQVCSLQCYKLWGDGDLLNVIVKELA